MSVKDRIPAGLARKLESNPFRHPNRYVDWQGHQLLAETVCKRCGAVLTALGPDPRMPMKQRELKGTKVRTIIQEILVARLRTNLFDTIEFEVEEPVKAYIPEGDETRDEEPQRLGLHRTAICTDCKTALLDGKGDLQEVQYLYEADLERMAVEDEANRVPSPHTLKVIEQLASRKVLRIV